MYRLLFIIPLIIYLTLSACYKDNEEELYGLSCETDNVSYANDVKTVLENYCLAYHNNSNASSLGGGIELEGPELEG